MRPASGVYVNVCTAFGLPIHCGVFLPLETLGHSRVREAQGGAGTIEIRRTHDHAAQLAALHFVH